MNFYLKNLFSILNYCLLIIFSFQNFSLASFNDETSALLEQGVIVRVWSGALHSGEYVGHASLQTSKDYISFWPCPDEQNTGHFNSSIYSDLESEGGRSPESTILLNHPDENAVDRISQNFAFLKDLLNERFLSWNISSTQNLKTQLTREFFDGERNSALLLPEADRKIFKVYSEWNFNCSSIVYNILTINKYLEFNQNANTTITPDRLRSLCAMRYIQNNNIENSKVNLARSCLFFKSLGVQIITNPNIEEDIRKRINLVSARSPMLQTLASLDEETDVTSFLADVVERMQHKK